jgi:hypothetical protein
MMFMGMAPLGSLLAGIMAKITGAPLTIAMGGVLCIAGASAFALQLKEIRTEARELIIAQQMAGGEPPQGVKASS